MFTVVVLPITTAASLISVLKPVTSTRTSYEPAGKAGSLKRPSALAVKVRAKLVSLLVIVTLAFGMMAPDSSVIVPVIIPVGACANAAKLASRASNINQEVAFDIVVPSQ